MDNRVPTQPPPAVQQTAPMQAPLPQSQVQMAQYPQPQAIVNRWDVVPFSRPWHIAKLVLGSMSIVFCVVIFGCSIYFYSTFYAFRTAFQFGMVGAAVSPLAPKSLSICSANDALLPPYRLVWRLFGKPPNSSQFAPQAGTVAYIQVQMSRSTSSYGSCARLRSASWPYMLP